jgi:hypothetical protein
VCKDGDLKQSAETIAVMLKGILCLMKATGTDEKGVQVSEWTLNGA